MYTPPQKEAKVHVLTICPLALSALLLSTPPVDGGPAPSRAAVHPDTIRPDAIRVVTTQPVYASLAREVGGDHVDAAAIAPAAEDPHMVRPKPSYAMLVRRADLFVTTGLDLELWVPPLLDRAGNARVLEGSRGYVTAYTGIELLDLPQSLDRSVGDIHVYGNPHLHTDPLRTLQIARNITVGLKRLAPERATEFDERLVDFEDRTYRRLFGDELVDMLGGDVLADLARQGRLFSFLETNSYRGAPLMDRLGGWMAMSAPFRGRDVICYHKNWSYFEERFHVHCVEYVESRPGIPPTPHHVARLIDLMREQGIRVVLAADYFDARKVETVARRGGGIPVVVPLSLETDRSYFELVDTWVTSLAEAFRAADQRAAAPGAFRGRHGRGPRARGHGPPHIRR